MPIEDEELKNLCGRCQSDISDGEDKVNSVGDVVGVYCPECGALNYSIGSSVPARGWSE